MTRLLKSLNVTPPGGWRYIDPDTRYQYNRRYASFEALLAHIRRYRAHNRLRPIPRLRFTVQEWLCCQSKMERFCREIHERRTIKQYFKGAVAAAKMLLGDIDPLVEQEIADKRAQICIRCKFNEIPTERTLLEELTDQKIQEVVGDKSTSYDRNLYMCSICSCPLRAKVHIIQEIVEEALSDEEKYRMPSGMPGVDGNPVYCWQTNPVEIEEE